jgi:hypothetical protein
MAVVLVEHSGEEGGGTVRATNALALMPALQPVTWLLQVMPVFFLVGGFSHATALESLRRRGGTYADFVRNRAGRLLRPTGIFVGVWLGFALLLEVTGQDGAGVDGGVLALATRTVAQPLWFVGVYLGIVALAPAMLALHRRLGHRVRRRATAVPVALAAGAALVDALRFGADVPYVGYLNVVLVWLAVHQVGFLYADGTLTATRPREMRVGFALAGVGLAATVALTVVGPYPVSMVGMPGEPVSNMSPPTLALLAHATWLTGLVLLLRGPVSRWLRRPAVWRRVVAANGVAMTAFLWHLTAMFAATALTLGVGLTQPAVGSPGWWLLRPVWIAVLAGFTVGFVLAFRRADRPATVPAAPTRPEARTRPVVPRDAAAGTGITLCVVGVLGLSAVGFGGALAGRTATLVVVQVTPLMSAAVLIGGALLLRLTRPRRT